jgi:hypothetical protein
MNIPLPLNFTTSLPLAAYYHPAGDPPTADWHELERGPGYISLPAESEMRLRIKTIDDATLAVLVREIGTTPWITALDLSENRNISDQGLKYLSSLKQLTFLNLSSCGITAEGLSHLSRLSRLQVLDLSFCNRLSDAGLKYLRPLSNLSLLNVQGCVKLSHGGLAKLQRRGLTIHEK